MNNLYFHKGQKYFLAHPANTKVAICGRGYGKTTMDSIEAYSCYREMPRSRGFFLGLTYTQILTKFLPPILDVWGRIGLKEHKGPSDPGHYVVGVKPPDHWPTPYSKVKKYQNIISIYNGAIIDLLSMDRPDLNRGASYDWGLADEVQLINRDRFYTEYYVAIRGNIHRYKSKRHQRLVLTGSMPWLTSGQWVLDFGEKAKVNKDILYLERSAYDNIDALGVEYFKRQKAELPALIYQIEIENKRVQILGDGFYPEFNEANHCYYGCYNYSDEQLPSISNIASYKPSTNDYDPLLPLEISFDFGANVTLVLVAQEADGHLRFINCFYETAGSTSLKSEVESELKNPLQRVLAKFTAQYGQHKGLINIWGDHTGHNRNDRSDTSYQVVQKFLRDKKMHFFNRVEYTTNPFHTKKYHIINEILSGKNTRCPKIKINQNYCKELIISIQLTPINDDFKKDKRSERDMNLPVERQTHFSDAFDYLVFNKYKHLFMLDGGGDVSISIGRM